MREQLEAQARKREGQELGSGFRLVRLLDIGGMAAVFEGRGPDGEEVAVKVLHRLYATNEEAKKRFLEEAYVANQVGHPSIVQVLGDGELPDGAAFLVMDLLRGSSLEAELARVQTLPPTTTLIIADAILDVLRAAHAVGIIHRDIKPPNVFLTKDAKVKILDFGLARVKERSLRGELTRDGMVVGTAAYMPPEQARGKRDLITVRTDIWAVGATMFRALSGRYVHMGKGTERLIQAMTQKAPPLQSVAPNVPSAVCELVDRALAYQQSDRWQTAEEMQRAVHDAYRSIADAVIPSARSAVVQASGAASRSQAMDSVDSVDSDALDVSVVFEPSSTGSVFVNFEDESGHKERYEITHTAPLSSELPTEDRLSNVALHVVPPKK